MKRPKIIIFIFLIIILLIIFYSKKPATEIPLKIIMLDIGQGDAIYIETPNGKNMLIDSGRDRTITYELGNIIPAGKKNIDTIEISNPDLDHIGGIPFVMEKYSISQILSPGTNHDSLDSYKEIEKIAKDKKIPIIRAKQGTIFVLDSINNVTYKILWPENNVRNWEANASSMIGLLEYNGHKVLLTGDAPKEVEDQIVSKYKNELQNIDILKVGHHGSKTSTGGALAMLARPKYALISAGLKNYYGHPHKETLDILNSVNSKILLTATHGQITCKIWVKKEVECK
ncbi:hypothetical protein A2903_01095 [Candidatus Nomurabacteria bacterium RIFCSPLOWO2_01_FULL_33_17]|uniref:Metallo-beta-lactamase domain-containing protein n=1 Tax=Candidatus Nomurabacteria bacterium RIFCSPLOWO2_01_FULL_33_17 TaxID=1801764 RepID=A0A1F6WPE8_9BACT|nr:MAG: hypothetical protein A2903_01095 [Candidatus Nomurabacteria bacterium RIFCSPLOWO2_01_FULL_33_17]